MSSGEFQKSIMVIEGGANKMTLKLNYKYLQSYLNFYYERLPRINFKNKDKQISDLAKPDIYKLTIESEIISKENPLPVQQK